MKRLLLSPVSLEQRLVLINVVFPVLLILVSGMAVFVFVRKSLINSVDSALRAQATAESVSLFDGPGGTIHLHAVNSPIRRDIGASEASVAVYDPRGMIVARSGPLAAPTRVRASGITFSTLNESTRELRVRVPAPNGEFYSLWLARDMDNVQDALAAFRRFGLLGLFIFTLLLLGVQVQHVHWLTRRLRRLAEFMDDLDEGRSSHELPADPLRDVIAGLRDSIARAALRLHEAKLVQTRFLAGAAHELRTPLAALRATVDVTLRRERSNAELVTALHEVREETVKLGHRANLLLDLAAMNSDVIHFENCELASLLRDAAFRYRTTADEVGVFLRVVAAKETFVFGSRSWLEVALDNLVVNAIQHAERDSDVSLELSDDGVFARIDVVNVGQPIVAEHREQLFAPFFRGRRDAGGAGLGLALARAAVVRHGGTIELSGIEPTCFTIRLPLPTR